MESVLSQSEVNALLNAVNQGAVEVDPDDDGSRSEARKYDLTSNDRIIRGRMPTLDILSQRLARLIRITLANLLRKSVDVTHESTELMKFGEFVNTVTIPGCLNIFKMPPLRNLCLVSIDSDLLFGVVEQIFGGSGGWFRVEGREYSTVELRIIERVVNTLLEDLGTAWESVIKVSPEFVRTEMNPQFASIVAPSDVVLNIAYDVELEGASKGRVGFVIPYAVIEPIRNLLTSAVQTDRGDPDGAWKKTIIDTLMEMLMGVTVRLGTGSLEVRQLMQLKVGDIIRLGADASQPLEMEIEGVSKFKGWPVTSRGRLAVKLESGPLKLLDDEIHENEGEVKNERRESTIAKTG